MAIQESAPDGARIPVTGPQRPAAPGSGGLTSPTRAVAAIAPAAVRTIGMVAAVNVAIPALQASGLHPSVSSTAWIVDSYLTTRFASHLPAALRAVPGPQGQAIRQSITAALHYAASTPNPALRAQLIDGTRNAFTSGTSLGLRVGAALILLTAVLVALQHPKEQPQQQQ
jgi:hypothetical protein